MELDMSVMDETSYIKILPAGNSLTKKHLEVVVEQADQLAKQFESLIMFPNDKFWSTVANNSSFMEAFSTAVNLLPLPDEVERYRIFFEWDQQTSKVSHRLRFVLLAVYFRLSLYNENNMAATLSIKQWISALRNTNLLNREVECAVWVHYPENWKLFASDLKLRCQQDKQLTDDILKNVTGICEKSSLLSIESRAIFDRFYMAEEPEKCNLATILDEFLSVVVYFCNYFEAALFVYHNADAPIEFTDTLITCIPSLIDAITRNYSIEALYDVAMRLEGYPMRRLLETMHIIETVSAKAFWTLLTFVKGPKKYQAVKQILQFERFLFILAESYPLTELLKNSSSNQMSDFNRRLEAVRNSQTQQIMEKLARQGLLKDLGNLSKTTPERRQTIKEMADMFPHLSIEFVHLLLRHFNYVADKAISAVLQEELLPLDLKRIINLQLSAIDGPVDLPPLNFVEDDALNSIQRPVVRAVQPIVVKKTPPKSNSVSKGLFSLAPVAAASEPSEPEIVQETVPSASNNVSEAMKQMQAALDRLKLRAIHLQTTQEGAFGEKLVPMANAKRYAGINKFKPNEADKIAIRPSYEKYKYATISDDEDLYNDEYDDGFEQREFQVEPLNGYISSSSDEDLPDDNPTSSTSQQPAAQRGRGRGRGGRGGRGARPTGPVKDDSTKQQTAPPPGMEDQTAPRRQVDYTGGRERQMKERHKNMHKQRGADRKHRGGY